MKRSNPLPPSLLWKSLRTFTFSGKKCCICKKMLHLQENLAFAIKGCVTQPATFSYKCNISCKCKIFLPLNVKVLHIEPPHSEGKIYSARPHNAERVRAEYTYYITFSKKNLINFFDDLFFLEKRNFLKIIKKKSNPPWKTSATRLLLTSYWSIFYPPWLNIDF